MGLFSRKKDESSGLPPVPMPPVAQSLDRLNASPADVSKPAPFLSAPAVPSRSSLDEIKSQVVPRNSNMSAPSMNSSQSSEADSLENDSLFDFSTLDLGESPALGNDPKLDQSHNSSRLLSDSSSSFVDKNVASEGNLSFVTNKNRYSKSGSSNDSLFVTTSQFKSFLEIIEQVRGRVKNSSDRHLRLLDIKSEEDLEYENLRKDFQYIEDKLYEVDGLIFER